VREYQATEAYRRYLQACWREALHLPWIWVSYGEGKKVAITLQQWANQGGE